MIPWATKQGKHVDVGTTISEINKHRPLQFVLGNVKQEKNTAFLWAKNFMFSHSPHNMCLPFCHKTVLLFVDFLNEQYNFKLLSLDTISVLYRKYTYLYRVYFPSKYFTNLAALVQEHFKVQNIIQVVCLFKWLHN